MAMRNARQQSPICLSGGLLELSSMHPRRRRHRDGSNRPISRSTFRDTDARRAIEFDHGGVICDERLRPVRKVGDRARRDPVLRLIRMALQRGLARR